MNRLFLGFMVIVPLGGLAWLAMTFPDVAVVIFTIILGILLLYCIGALVESIIDA